MSEDYFKKYLDEKFSHLTEKIVSIDSRLKIIEDNTIINPEIRRNNEGMKLLKHIKTGVVWVSAIIVSILGIDKLMGL